MEITPAPIAGRIEQIEKPQAASPRKPAPGVATRCFDWVRRDAHDDPQSVPFSVAMAVQHRLHKLALLRATTGGG